MVHPARVLVWVGSIATLIAAETSNKLETGIIPTSAVVGQSVDLSCSSASESLTFCRWISNQGDVYLVENGLVTNEEGNLVNGITSEASDPRSCQITIQTLAETQLGTWTCSVELGEGWPFQNAFLSVITGARVQDVRIPTQLLPEMYDISLIPFILPGNFTIKGEVTALLMVQETTSVVHLHAKDMLIYEDLVSITREDSSEALTIQGFGYDSARDFFLIYLGQSLVANDRISVNVHFLGNLNDDLSGFYRSSYEDPPGTVHYLATTQFQATDARKAFLCMDEPGLKSVFKIRLGRTSDFRSVSNMPIENEGVSMAEDGSYVWDEFVATEKMSSYLIAFMVSDLDFIESDPALSRMPFRIWAKPPVIDQTAFAADIGPRILTFYEGYFGLDFPLPKQDMAAVPDLSFGGMENWGLIMYRDTALLYQPGVSSLQNKNRVTDVVAHELAHQWFGDLVTMGWWSDLWLNEGFASFVSYLGQEHVLPDFAGLDRIALENHQVVFQQDALETSHPVSVSVNHPDEINEIFDNISYEKGCSLIQMMVNFLGQSTFNKGIRSYLQTFAFGNAFQGDLWEALTIAAQEDSTLPQDLSVEEIMDTWTLQKGFPVITATRDGPNSVLLSQTRFLVGTPDPSDDHLYRWWVPISYAASGGDFSQTKNPVWMSPSEETKVIQVEISVSDALILNVQETAYFRVNYDPDNWNLIAQVLLSDTNAIHRVNRAQILDDSLNLAKVGLLGYETALDQTEFLDQEEDFIPWQAARSGLSYLSLMMKRKPDYVLFQDYMSQKVDHLFQRLGLDPLPEDTYFDTLLRQLSVGYLCSFGDPDCLDPALDQFNGWMASPNPDDDAANPIDASVRSTVYCSAIANGDAQVWDFLFERYSKSNNGNERANILGALGCSANEATLESYLAMAMDPASGIRKQDGATVVSSVAGNSIGTSVAWQWMRSDWDDIRSYFDTAVSSPVAKMINSVTRSFNSAEELNELEQFYQSHQNNLGTGQRATEAAIESTKANIAWMESYYDVIVAWLLHKRT